MSASTPSWEAVILAALGSSAVGTIVGGYLTTRLRGQIERNEAWRSRLVEASDELVPELRRTAGELSWPWLIDVVQRRTALRAPGGALTEDATRMVSRYKRKRDRLLPPLSRIEILYGPETSELAMRAVRNLDSACATLEGEQWVYDAIRQVLRKDRSVLEIADNVDLPDRFDPRSDSSLASWASVLLESAEVRRREFVNACAVRVHGNRPSRMDPVRD